MAFAVFVGWVLITVFSSRLWAPAQGPRSIDQAIAQSVQPNLALAILFLLAMIALFRWRDIGFVRPAPRSIRMLWFPGLYILAFVAFAAKVGLPPAERTLIILVNTMMVGISEELACRGVLFGGLRSRWPLWPAAIGSSLLFGAVHLLNGFTTGNFTTAAIQAVAAFMTGMAFLGVRIRTGSLYPAMLLHGIWDFMLVATLVALPRMSGASEAGQPGLLWMTAVPVLLILPNFLYGLFLIRSGARNFPATV